MYYYFSEISRWSAQHQWFDRLTILSEVEGESTGSSRFGAGSYRGLIPHQLSTGSSLIGAGTHQIFLLVVEGM